MKASASRWLGILLPVLLWACQKDPARGGKPVNKLVAAAGADRAVPVNAPVQLDGSASADGNGKTFTYAWRFTKRPAGSQAALTQAATARPAFTPDVAGTYVVELKIANAGGQATDAVTITATAGDPGEPTAGIIGGDITQDRHLGDVFSDPAKADYLVTADVKVSARLSLAPGMVVAFEDYFGRMFAASGAGCTFLLTSRRDFPEIYIYSFPPAVFAARSGPDSG